MISGYTIWNIGVVFPSILLYLKQDGLEPSTGLNKPNYRVLGMEPRASGLAGKYSYELSELYFQLWLCSLLKRRSFQIFWVVSVQTWRSKENLLESVLSFHHVGESQGSKLRSLCHVRWQVPSSTELSAQLSPTHT